MSLTVALTVLFVALKLFGVIAWPWLWCFAPVLASLTLTVSIVLFMAAIAGLTGSDLEITRR